MIRSLHNEIDFTVFVAFQNYQILTLLFTENN